MYDFDEEINRKDTNSTKCVNVKIRMYEKWKIIMYKKYPKRLQNPP